MKRRHVIIVGGGASGLVAAISAARCGARVTIVEQKDRVGKKILSTGNGRCNLTNEYMTADCFRGDDTSIVAKVLEQFGYQETMQFFEELGVILKARQGYVYPISDQASTILDVLRMEVARLGVHLLLEQSVTAIVPSQKGFAVKTTKTSLTGDAVILATGGKAAPTLGSDGSGYALAKELGHHLSPVVPALVQLKGKGNFWKQVAGVRTQAKVSLYVDQQFVADDTGELQLTNYGISGIPVFQISRYAAKGLQEKKFVTAEIDFMPHMSESEFDCFMKERIKTHGHKMTEDFLIGVFHKKIIGLLLKVAQLSNSDEVNQIEETKWQAVIKLCKHFRVEIEATNDFEQAQVCAGGVKTSELNASTMESLCMDNLYLTGELLDIDGICGGYNLQWAWSTGYIAGKFAAKGN